MDIGWRGGSPWGTTAFAGFGHRVGGFGPRARVGPLTAPIYWTSVTGPIRPIMPGAATGSPAACPVRVRPLLTPLAANTGTDSSTGATSHPTPGRSSGHRVAASRCRRSSSSVSGTSTRNGRSSFVLVGICLQGRSAAALSQDRAPHARCGRDGVKDEAVGEPAALQVRVNCLGGRLNVREALRPQRPAPSLGTSQQGQTVLGRTGTILP